MYGPSELMDMYHRDRRRFEHEMYEVGRRDHSLYDYVMREIRDRERVLMPPMQMSALDYVPENKVKPKKKANKKLLLLEEVL
ncbi:MAG: hypothetical protein V3U75_01360 [Methylococcaceae bacterium]